MVLDIFVWGLAWLFLGSVSGPSDRPKTGFGDTAQSVTRLYEMKRPVQLTQAPTETFQWGYVDDVAAGQIVYGEQNTEHFHLKDWRQLIGYVSQESPLVSNPPLT